VTSGKLVPGGEERLGLELDPQQLLVVGELEQVAPVLVLPSDDGAAVGPALELGPDEGHAQVAAPVHELHQHRERGLGLDGHDRALVGVVALDQRLDGGDAVVAVGDVLGDDLDIFPEGFLQEGGAFGVGGVAGDTDDFFHFELLLPDSTGRVIFPSSLRER